MNISSLLITLVGIIIIIGLYLMSRLAQSKQPQIQQTQIPRLKNADGTKFSSVVEDIAATDGSTPRSQALNKVSLTDKDKPSSIKSTDSNTTPQQIILFISPDTPQDELDGNLITQALKENKLSLGEKNIYHYYLDNNSAKTSLFRVANGTKPWTLKKEDLQNKKIAGLSLVMSLPAPIENKKAVKTLLDVAKRLSKSINGILKDDTQQALTKEHEKKLLTL